VFIDWVPLKSLLLVERLFNAAPNEREEDLEWLLGHSREGRMKE
jgi:hypothetical protein